MKPVEILMILIGVGLVLFGFIIFAGGLLMMMDDAGEHTFLESALMTTLLGILPMTAGVILFRRALARRRSRQFEQRERTLLQLALQNDGRLTVVDVSMNMSVSSTEAKNMLEQSYLNGLAEIESTADGTVVYLFRTG